MADTSLTKSKVMFFKKKSKEPLKAYIINDLNSGLKKMIRDGLIDVNSPLAGVHIMNYISHMKNSYTKSASMMSIHYSTPYPTVIKKIEEATEEFKNEWLK